MQFLKARSLNNFSFYWYHDVQFDQNIMRVYNSSEQLVDVRSFNDYYAMELDANGNIVLLNGFSDLDIYHYNPIDTQLSTIASGGTGMGTVHDIEINHDRSGYLIYNTDLYERPLGSGWLWRATGITVNPGILETDKNDGNVLFILAADSTIQTVKDEVLSDVSTPGLSGIAHMVVENDSSAWVVANGGNIYYTNDGMISFRDELLEGGPAAISQLFLSWDRSAIFAYGEGRIYRY
jgi:hypothetical protein